MSKIQDVIKKVSATIEETRPESLDDLIDCVHNSGLTAEYGTSFHIVQYMGAIQGIKVGITGRKKTHYLPKVGSYAALKNVQKYIDAGYPVEYIGYFQGESKPFTVIMKFKDSNIPTHKCEFKTEDGAKLHLSHLIKNFVGVSSFAVFTPEGSKICFDGAGNYTFTIPAETCDQMKIKP